MSFKNSGHAALMLTYGASERNIIEDNPGIRFASTEELIYYFFSKNNYFLFVLGIKNSMLKLLFSHSNYIIFFFFYFSCS